MKEFVFYTFEGYTESPTGKLIENIQVLGFENGSTETEAKEKLLSHSKWIEKTGFNKYEIESRQILNNRLKKLNKNACRL